jgi:hypothetical protein
MLSKQIIGQLAALETRAGLTSRTLTEWDHPEGNRILKRLIAQGMVVVSTANELDKLTDQQNEAKLAIPVALANLSAVVDGVRAICAVRHLGELPARSGIEQADIYIDADQVADRVAHYGKIGAFLSETILEAQTKELRLIRQSHELKTTVADKTTQLGAVIAKEQAILLEALALVKAELPATAPARRHLKRKKPTKSSGEDSSSSSESSSSGTSSQTSSSGASNSGSTSTSSTTNASGASSESNAPTNTNASAVAPEDRRDQRSNNSAERARTDQDKAHKGKSS